MVMFIEDVDASLTKVRGGEFGVNVVYGLVTLDVRLSQHPAGGFLRRLVGLRIVG